MNNYVLHALILSRNTQICRSSFHSQNTWRAQIQKIVPAQLKHWPSLSPWCRHLIVEHFALGFGVAKILFQNVALASFVACPSFDIIVCCCHIACFLCCASFNYCPSIHTKLVSVLESSMSRTSSITYVCRPDVFVVLISYNTVLQPIHEGFQ
jgi:hypothetical protein